jgi:hypothetical protein
MSSWKPYPVNTVAGRRIINLANIDIIEPTSDPKMVVLKMSGGEEVLVLGIPFSSWENDAFVSGE